MRNCQKISRDANHNCKDTSIGTPPGRIGIGLNKSELRTMFGVSGCQVQRFEFELSFVSILLQCTPDSMLE